MLKFRGWIQGISFVFFNLYWKFIFTLNLYQGKLRGVCVPVLHCYACPMSWSSCPVGIVQHFLKKKIFPFYPLGILTVTGAILGRATCGWICPFGWIQKLLWKLGRPLRLPTLPLPHSLWWIKYLVIIVVIALALLTPYPWFCKAFCPAGTLLGAVPLLAVVKDLRPLAGTFFYIKIAIIGVFIVLFLTSHRPFCRFFCPLGATLGLANRISLMNIQLNEEKCTKCNICSEQCPMGLVPYKEAQSTNCIRCMECVKVCPTSALSFVMGPGGIEQTRAEDQLKNSPTV